MTDLLGVSMNRQAHVSLIQKIQGVPLVSSILKAFQLFWLCGIVRKMMFFSARSGFELPHFVKFSGDFWTWSSIQGAKRHQDRWRWFLDWRWKVDVPMLRIPRSLQLTREVVVFLAYRFRLPWFSKKHSFKTRQAGGKVGCRAMFLDDSPLLFSRCRQFFRDGSPPNKCPDCGEKTNTSWKSVQPTKPPMSMRCSSPQVETKFHTFLESEWVEE